MNACAALSHLYDAVKKDVFNFLAVFLLFWKMYSWLKNKQRKRKWKSKLFAEKYAAGCYGELCLCHKETKLLQAVNFQSYFANLDKSIVPNRIRDQPNRHGLVDGTQYEEHCSTRTVNRSLEEFSILKAKS